MRAGIQEDGLKDASPEEVHRILVKRRLVTLGATLLKRKVNGADLIAFADHPTDDATHTWAHDLNFMQRRHIRRMVRENATARTSVNRHSERGIGRRYRISIYHAVAWAVVASILSALLTSKMMYEGKPLRLPDFPVGATEGVSRRGDESTTPVSTLLVIAGLEGTGHHMWHDYIFPHLQHNISDEFVHISEHDTISKRLKRMTKYPFAFIGDANPPASSISSTSAPFRYGENADIEMAEALTELQRLRPSKRRLYALDICSFPCGPDRTHGHDPDLQLLARAVARADPPMRLRVLLGWRDLKEAVASATYNRKCCFFNNTLAIPYQANVIRLSLMHLNSQLNALSSGDDSTRSSCLRALSEPDALFDWAVLDYNRFVETLGGRTVYVRRLCEWLGLSREIEDALLVASVDTVRMPRKRFADQFTVPERMYLNEIFESAPSRLLWKSIDDGRGVCDLARGAYDPDHQQLS